MKKKKKKDKQNMIHLKKNFYYNKNNKIRNIKNF